MAARLCSSTDLANGDLAQVLGGLLQPAPQHQYVLWSTPHHSGLASSFAATAEDPSTLPASYRHFRAECGLVHSPTAGTALLSFKPCQYVLA